MLRLSLLLLSLTALGGVAADDKAKEPAADSKTKGKLVIRWHGRSFFEIISTKGTRIVIDPHAVEVYGKRNIEADLILMTHFHDDHTRIDVLKNAKQAKQFNGLKVVDKQVEWNILNETFKDVKFSTVPSFHDSFFGMKRGKNSAFILEVDGLRIAHMGDLGHKLDEKQIKKFKDVDILMIPIGGTYTINGLDAREIIDAMKPLRYVIPMHYGTDIDDDLLTIPRTGFLDEFDESRVKRLPTNQLIIDPKEPAPKEWSIIIPSYKEEPGK